MKSFLTPLLLTIEGRKAPAIIDIYEDNTIVVSDFTTERANTTYIPEAIALLNRDAITDFLLDDVQLILQSMAHDRYDRLDNLFRPSGLYFQNIKTLCRTNSNGLIILVLSDKNPYTLNNTGAVNISI